MDARDKEQALLTLCLVAARDKARSALDQREASVFRLAASIIGSRFPAEAANLYRASQGYFATRPEDRLQTADVVKNGWVLDVPRLRDMLCHQLERSR
jgi:hypothetical protein